MIHIFWSTYFAWLSWLADILQIVGESYWAIFWCSLLSRTILWCIGSPQLPSNQKTQFANYFNPASVGEEMLKSFHDNFNLKWPSLMVFEICPFVPVHLSDYILLHFWFLRNILWDLWAWCVHSFISDNVISTDFCACVKNCWILCGEEWMGGNSVYFWKFIFKCVFLMYFWKCILWKCTFWKCIFWK